MTLTINDLENQDVTVSATIINGSALSNTIDTQGFAVKGIIWPSAWTPASLSMQGSVDNVNFFPLVQSGGTNINWGTAATVSMFVFQPANAPAAVPTILPRYLQLWSETGGSSVNQLANRVFTVVLCPNINRKP